MKRNNSKLATAIFLVLLFAALMSGCAASQPTAAPVTEKGILTLSVNPEIQIEYDKNGKVTALTGQNDDGKAILSAYPDYIGKPCETVLNDLIAKINQAGYFVADAAQGSKNIVLQLEPGSILPSENFLLEMSATTQNALQSLNLGSQILTIDNDDYDPAYAKNGQPSPYITLQKAKEIALAHAGVSAADAVFVDKEFDHDDGTPIFELEFNANGQEYEYDIHAVTGKTLKAQREAADVQRSAPSHNARPDSQANHNAAPASSRAPHYDDDRDDDYDDDYDDYDDDYDDYHDDDD